MIDKAVRRYFVGRLVVMPKIYSHNNTFLTGERKSGGKRAIGSMAILGNESRAVRGSIKKLKRSYICCYASPVESHLQYLSYCASLAISVLLCLICNTSVIAPHLQYLHYCASFAIILLCSSTAIHLLLYFCCFTSVVIALQLYLCNQFCHRASSIQIIALYIILVWKFLTVLRKSFYCTNQMNNS